MKILVIAATPFEIAPTLDFLERELIRYKTNHFQKGPNSCALLISGVGLPATIFQLTHRLNKEPFDLVINAGIAGAFDPDTEIGSVWQVIQDRFGDLGIQEADGRFLDLFEMELCNPNEFPCQNGMLDHTQEGSGNFLPKATAITVNKVHGMEADIAAIQKKYPVHLESMEGAGVFYVCQLLGIPALQIRAVSNYVEPRNRDNWNIPLAIEELNKVLIQILGSLL